MSAHVVMGHPRNKDGEPMPLDVVLHVCRELGYDPATVQQVHIHPLWVDVTTFADEDYRFTVPGGQSSACSCSCGGTSHVRTLVTRHAVVLDPVVDLGSVGVTRAELPDPGVEVTSEAGVEPDDDAALHAALDEMAGAYLDWERDQRGLP